MMSLKEFKRFFSWLDHHYKSTVILWIQAQCTNLAKIYGASAYIGNFKHVNVYNTGLSKLPSLNVHFKIIWVIFNFDCENSIEKWKMLIMF